MTSLDGPENVRNELISLKLVSVSMSEPASFKSADRERDDSPQMEVLCSESNKLKRGDNIKISQ